MGHILTKFHNEKENDNQYSKKSNNGPTDSEESNSITPVYSVPTESSSLRNREFHMEEEASYWLPKDEDEQLRLMGVSLYIYIYIYEEQMHGPTKKFF